MPNTTVLIASGYRLFREAVRPLLESDPALRVVGESSESEETIELARTLAPDVLLLDEFLPIREPLDTLWEINRSAPSVRTLLLTVDERRVNPLAALTVGARGVVKCEAATDLLFKSIHVVMAGHYWVGRDALDGVIGEMQMRARSTKPSAESPAALSGLTPRELQVVDRIVAGGTNGDIAKELSISVKTVKRHLTSIFDRVGTANRLELASLALRHRVGTVKSPLQTDRT
jgi:DNA-binding NarL/FixJ family response regulator